jgi:threonine dehydrogenase-like Zn-dependent dehydrogenase
VGLSFVKLGRLLDLGYIGVVDPVKEKRDWALAMGADEVFAPESDGLAELVGRRGEPLDAVVDAVGSESIVNAGLDLVKMGGSICVYGVIAEPNVELQKHRGPYNFNLFVHQWPTRFRERAALKPLCNWIRSGQLRPGEFITHEYPVEKIGEALATVASGRSLKVLLRY